MTIICPKTNKVCESTGCTSEHNCLTPTTPVNGDEIKDEWDLNMKKHQEIEHRLIDLIIATENNELIDTFLEWQENRNTLNEGWVKWVENQLKK